MSRPPTTLLSSQAQSPARPLQNLGQPSLPPVGASVPGPRFQSASSALGQVLTNILLAKHRPPPSALGLSPELFCCSHPPVEY